MGADISFPLDLQITEDQGSSCCEKFPIPLLTFGRSTNSQFPAEPDFKAKNLQVITLASKSHSSSTYVSYGDEYQIIRMPRI